MVKKVLSGSCVIGQNFGETPAGTDLKVVPTHSPQVGPVKSTEPFIQLFHQPQAASQLLADWLAPVDQSQSVDWLRVTDLASTDPPVFAATCEQ